MPSGTYPTGDLNAGQNVMTTILSTSTTQKITEGANGIALYTPTSGQPGFNNGTGAAPFSYEFISSVPEPTTMIAGALLLLPLGASTLRILRKNRRRNGRASRRFHFLVCHSGRS